MTKVLTVSQLNEQVRLLLASEPALQNIEVNGEISGYKHHSSGHRYFSLKDATARVQCVMFRAQASGLNFQPADGMKVTVRATASIYARDGSYQLYVQAMRKDGIGDLYVRFEQLKQKLNREGLFDPSRKRPIPFFPKCIGLVTSPTGAAVRDMIRVSRRRNPNLSILISPCQVQGEQAASSIVRAIERINNDGRCDVLLVGRGGGSIEDLWPFNEEIVARAIAKSNIPVISCVGHEVDFTIADFVADMRAATPSAAAELAVPVLADMNARLFSLRGRLITALSHGQTVRRQHLNLCLQSMAIKDPRAFFVAPAEERLMRASIDLERSMRGRVEKAYRRLELAQKALVGLDPEGTLGRGYAYVTKGETFVQSVMDLHGGETVSIHLNDGKIFAGVFDIEPKEEVWQRKS